MNFGLGLVLSFTDNATAGINNAVNSLDRLTEVAEGASNSLNQIASLSAFSVVADQLGSAFLNVGGTILSTFGQIIGAVNETGTTMLNAERQLSQLYGSSEKGAEVLNKIQDYAKKSIFNFEDLIPVVTSLKAVGIEAFDSIATSTGSANQTLMDYAADLAAFNPMMRNAYGTGIQAAMGAIKEYIAEGNAMSLKRGAGLDITQILGEDKGATIEERSQQIADLIDKLGMIGMTANLAGTPTQMLSNMEDVLFQLKSMISESGVYETYTNLIAKMFNYVNEISEKELQNIASIIGGALSTIMKPIGLIIDAVLGLADAFRNLAQTSPWIVKVLTIVVAMGGVVAVAIGIFLKFASALSGLSLLVIAFGESFKAIGGTLKVGLHKIMGSLIPLTMALALMSFAWKNDFAGIRTNVNTFVSNLSNSFKTAREAVNGSVSDLVSTLHDLNSKDDFFSNLTIAIMRVMVLFRALKEGWNDFTLSEDTFLKAKELGILPLIEAIFNLKYRFDHFKEGFIQGWNAVGNVVSNIIKGIASALDGTIFDSMFQGITNFFRALSDNDPQKWKEFGSVVGFLSAVFLLLYGSVRVASLMISGVTKVVGVASKTFGGLKKIVGGIFKPLISGASEVIGILRGRMITPITNIGKSLVNVGTQASKVPKFFNIMKTGVTTAVRTLASAVGVSFGAMSAIILAVVGTVATYAITHWEEFKSKVLTIWTTLKESIGGILSSLIGNVVSIFNNLKTAFVSIFEAIGGLKDRVVELWNIFKESESGQAIINILSAIGETIVNIVVPAINGLMRIASSVLQGLFNIFSTVFNSIVNIVASILRGLVNIVSGILDILIGIFTGDFGRIKQGVSTIFSAIANVIKTILTSIKNIVSSILSAIGNIFKNVGQTILNILKGAFQGMLSIAKSVLNAMLGKVRSIFNSIKSVVSSVTSSMSSIVSSKFSGIRNAITTAINGAKSAVTNAISKMKSAFNFKWSLPKLKLPHITITGSWSLKPPKAPKFDLDWYERGGVFNKPSVIGVGENGQEAVMPLENNTGWITQLAEMITSRMNGSEIVPSNSQVTNNNQGDTSNQEYLTTNNSSNQTIEGDTDNSITFNEGAIQVVVQNASEEEAMKFAKKVMEFIKRQKELDKMLNYA